MATVSYGMRITNASRVLDKTVQIYRDAVNYNGICRKPDSYDTGQ